MDYAALPPEVNSARMYTGPGSGPMLAAALAWDSLASELSFAAADYSSAVTDMTSGPWRGPASASVAAAAAPYVTWMGTTAAQALQAAGQAKAAAGAYQAAFAMTVPPPVIAANRTLLASLVATNLLGQNTPAIAATEAHYGEMWAQDAAAMYGYAASSAAASELTPFPEPPPTTSSEAAALAQTATTSNAGTQATISQLMSAVPTALQGLTTPTSTTGILGSLGLGGSTSAARIGQMENWLGLGGTDFANPAGVLSLLAGTDGSPLGAFINNNALNTLFSSGFYMPGNFLGTMTDFYGLQGAGAAVDAAVGNAAIASAGGLGTAMPGLPGLGGLGGAVSAGLGHATSIGPLSVPPTWTAPSPIGAAASALPGAGTGAPTIAGAAPSMLGGMPLSGSAGRGFGEVPRYGFRPTVVMHPPAAG